MSQHPLSQEDVEELIDILLKSQKIGVRKALCYQIGIDPKQLSFLNHGADKDFAIQLINYLNETDDQDGLCKLCCSVLIPSLKSKNYTSILENFSAKLNCKQFLTRPYGTGTRNQPTILKNSLIISKNKLIIIGLIIITGLAGYSYISNPVPTTPNPVPTTPNPVPTTPDPVPTTPDSVPTTPDSVPTTPDPVPTTPDPIPDYDIGIYGFNTSEGTFNQVLQWFTSVGFYVRSDSGIYRDKPSWFAQTPTVLYYHRSSQSEAIKFAEILSQKTGLSFQAQYVVPKDSLGVSPGRESETFFVHILEE